MDSSLKRIGSLLVVCLSTLFLNAGPFPTSYTAMVIPPLPVLKRDVTLVHSLHYQYPYAPPFRTSADGRVALSAREQVGGNLQFYLFVPEAVDATGTPFSMTSRPTTAPLIFPVTTPITVADSSFAPAGYAQQHHALCDGTVQVLPESGNTNPYANNSDLSCPLNIPQNSTNPVDCYKLWVITPATKNNQLTLFGTQVLVEVTNPKTTSAAINSVTVLTNTQIQGSTFSTPQAMGFQTLLEPMVTADGNLLVGRIQGTELTWTDSASNTVNGIYNIIYSVASNPPAYGPCDVRNWTTFYPVAHAFKDLNMNGGRYGMADYQLRDPENTPIPEQADIEGTYSWIDRMGRNLFFTHVMAGLFNPISTNNDSGVMTRYPDSCVGSQNCSDPTVAYGDSGIKSIEELSNTRGVTVAGRWTHGKMVQVDGLVNNTDYGLFLPDIDQRMVSLYSGTNWQLGSGRYNNPLANPTDYATNTTILDSFENLFTYLPTFKPITLREVVWQLNMGKGGDEIAFDDYINPEAFIISEMTASTNFTPYTLPNSGTNPVNPPTATYNDGFTMFSGFTSPIHMQNAATAVSALVSPTPQWNIPTSGIVTGSNGSTTSIPARVEPIAMGGIKGKGLWLQSGNYVNYQIVTQPQTVSAVPWFISLFMDIRTTNGGDDGIERRILTFPDGTEVDIKGTSILELYYAQAGTQTLLASKPLPTGLTMPTPGWWHLAFQVAPGGKSIGIFVNGYLLWTYTSTQALFQLTPGNLAVGGDPSSTTQGFNGWIDEFKVIAQNVDYETVCNHAHGTLVGLTKGVSDPFWWTVSGYYQSTTEQTFINGVLGAKSYPGYACYHDYSFDMNAAYIGSPEMTSGNLSSIRAALHFPEGPLVYNQFRPISTANSFCMSCHTDSGGQFSGTLHNSVVVPPSTYAPLVGGNQNTGFMDVDPRRQPMHNQRVIFGNIPLDFINHQYPSPAQVAPRTGTGLDQWTFQ